MHVEGSVALVTGANRGLGQAFARSLADLGARRVYAAARHPEEIIDNDVTPIMLDITSAEQVADASRRCADVNLLINNAVEARRWAAVLHRAQVEFTAGPGGQSSGDACEARVDPSVSVIAPT